MVRTYKGYASISGTATAAITLDVRRNGRVLGVQFVLTPTANFASGDYILCEASLYPSSQVQTNDGMGVLATAGAGGGALTSGSVTAVNAYKPCFGVDVRVGDRLYIHVLEAGTETWHLNVLIDVDETG